MEKRLSGVNDVEEPFWRRGTLRGYDSHLIHGPKFLGYGMRRVHGALPDNWQVTVSAGLIPEGNKITVQYIPQILCTLNIEA